MKLTRWAMWCFIAACGFVLLAVIVFVKIKFVPNTEIRENPTILSRRLRIILQELDLDYREISTLSSLHPSQRNVVMALLEIDRKQTQEFTKSREARRSESVWKSASHRRVLNLPTPAAGHGLRAFKMRNTILTQSQFESKLSFGSGEIQKDPGPEMERKYIMNIHEQSTHRTHDRNTLRTRTPIEGNTHSIQAVTKQWTRSITQADDGRELGVKSDVSVQLLDSEEIVRISQNPDIDVRGKWQMQQINKFCRNHKKDHMAFTLPSATNELHRRNLFRHLLFDDERKLLFCFVPKVGCTNMRRFFFVLQGLLPLESIYWEHVPEAQLREGIQIASFLNTTLTDSKRLKKIKNYWKFVIVRNPLERLLSAYLNKLSKPVNTSLNHHDHFEMQKLSILLEYKPQLVKEWLVNASQNQTGNLSVDFETYIRWIIDMPNDKLNEHYAPMIAITQPCRIRYNFYGNFKMYSSEVQQIAKKLDVPLEYFHDQPYHANDTSTDDLLLPFYSLVSPELKRVLFYEFYKELEFYYSLYPEERFTHFELLGVREDILSLDEL